MEIDLMTKEQIDAAMLAYGRMLARRMMCAKIVRFVRAGADVAFAVVLVLDVAAFAKITGAF